MNITEKTDLFVKILQGIEKRMIKYLNVMYNTDVTFELIPYTIYSESEIENNIYKCQFNIKVNSNDEDIRNRVYNEACERMYTIRDYINNEDFDNLKAYLNNLDETVNKLDDINIRIEC